MVKSNCSSGPSLARGKELPPSRFLSRNHHGPPSSRTDRRLEKMAAKPILSLLGDRNERTGYIHRRGYNALETCKNLPKRVELRSSRWYHFDSHDGDRELAAAFEPTTP